MLSISAYFCNSGISFALPPLNTKYISYSDFGQGEVLVLLHPLPTDKAFWLGQQQVLKQHFRVISLDLWGFGHSEGTFGRIVTMDEYADQIAQLLDQLYLKNAIIGGESMGGYVALAFLAKYPERVKGLILSNTQAIADNPAIKKAGETTAANVLDHGTEPLVYNFINQALSADASEQTRLELQNIAMVQTPSAIASALRGMSLRADSGNILANTELPILIITSDKDSVISPQQSANMHALAKNSKLVVISDAGHLSNLEQPEQWNKAVIDMFRKERYS